MTNIKWSILGVLAAAAMLAACDPYEDQSTAAPVVVAVTATNGAPSIPGLGDYTEGTASGTAWTVANVPSDCAAGVVTSHEPILFVTSNQVLDGASIQAGLQDCTPAGTPAWLTATPAAPLGETWYACFQPGTPSPDLGSNVVIFRDTSGGQSGWDTASLTEASNDAVTTYTFDGSVRDWQGQGMLIDVTVTVAPNPGVPGNPTYTSIAATSVTVNWTAAECVHANTTYTVERAPNVPVGTPPVDAPGTFAPVATGVAALSFGDTGLTTGTRYWYRVTAKASTGAYFGPASGATMVTTL